MMNKSKIARLLSLSAAVAGSILVSGYFTDVNAQTRDPFVKPGFARKRDARVAGNPGGRPTNAGPATPSVPAIEQRIEYYKRLREEAASNGQPLPKVTSVMTLNEMAVTGIFHTPRGYAAMVEATPIKLSYTIYPGEKFFDGQLVAVEENRLVFRRVVKTGPGKFVASVEHKPLRQQSVREQVQTASAAPAGTDTPAAAPVQAAQNSPAPAAPAVMVSPLDEMNSQPAKEEAGKAAKVVKKTGKVARNR